MSDLKKGIEWGIILYLFSLIFSFIIILALSRNLPSLVYIERFEPPKTTEVFDRNGQLIHSFYLQRRIIMPLDSIPSLMQKAFITVEDKDFYKHWGISLKHVVRALLVNLRYMRIKQGASTITQQLARNMFLTQKRTFKRKIQEAILTVRIERVFSKEEILERYLNQIYFGHGVYGVEAASKFYFGKHVHQLTPKEIAILVAIPRNPWFYSPIRHPERVLRRANFILKKLYENHVIPKEEYEEAITQPVVFVNQSEKEEYEDAAAYFLEMVRQYVINDPLLGEDFLYKAGGKIYTTLDMNMQNTAYRVVDSILTVFENQYKLSPKKADYVRDSLNPPKYLQGALVSIKPETGEIIALVGGRDFKDSQFNRITQARRQAGSAFKPILYTAAIDNGYNPSDLIDDSPITLETYENGEKTYWIPQNYDKRYLGKITLRKALALSRNLASVRLILDIGPETVIEYARKLGIKDSIPPYPSIAIGAATVVPLNLAITYVTLANYGIRPTPYFITRIEDSRGNVIEKFDPTLTTVLDSITSYEMISMMESVFDFGTGKNSRKYYHFTRPAAGKTGTTNDYRDAWFIGFTPDLVTAVWVGYDSVRTIFKGATGAVMALPIWATYMKDVLDTVPPLDFIEPSGIVHKEVCAISGLLPTPYCPETYDEIFREGYEPVQYCNIHIPPELRRAEEYLEKEELKEIKGQ